MKELLEETLKYIEDMVEVIDGEWGSGRSFEEVMNEIPDKVPQLYFKIKKELEEME